MSETDVADAPTPSGELALDPFGFMVGVASKITGLGGNAPGHDHDYVFHTPYVEAEEGPAHFIVRFQGLAARQGTLVLRVHMLPKEEGATARLATSERVALNRLVHHGGEHIVRFEGFRDVTFALYGGIAGNTDAEAEALTVTLDRPADPSRQPVVAAEARSTEFGRRPVKDVAHLVSLVPPTLADPVAQIATAAQLKEPAAVHWLGAMNAEDLSPLECWQAAYTMQVLRRYGMLEAGARGLGLGLADSPLPALLATHDIDVVATRSGEQPAADDPPGLAALARRAAGDGAAFRARVSARIAPLAALPEDLVNFDFLWSTGACEQLGSVAATIQFVEQAMSCLRPGGIAIHTMGYDLLSADQRLGSEAIFQRRDVERLALIQISRRNDVAQFKLAAPDALLEPTRGRPGAPLEAGAFGFIVRKPRLVE